jgi:hypothetical protein
MDSPQVEHTKTPLPPKSDIGELAKRSVGLDWERFGSLKAWGMGHSFCYVNGDLPIASGQPSSVRGIIYIYGAPKSLENAGAPWSVYTRVFLRNLPVGSRPYIGQKAPFQLEILDTQDPHIGCMVATALRTSSEGILGEIKADHVGNVNGATPPVSQDLTILPAHYETG